MVVISGVFSDHSSITCGKKSKFFTLPVNTQTYNLVHTIPAPSYMRTQSNFCENRKINDLLTRLHTDSSDFVEIAKQTTATKGFCRAEQRMIEMIGTYK